MSSEGRSMEVYGKASRTWRTRGGEAGPSPAQSLERLGAASFWAWPAGPRGPGVGLVSAAARRLVLASVHHGALRRGPSLKMEISPLDGVARVGAWHL